MLLPVSFITPALRPMFTPIMGGLFETKVKALKGARFSTPAAERVHTQAMGRGTMMPVSSL